MLIVAVPESELTGNCKINGRDFEYLVEPPEYFSFRPPGGDWDRRRILDASTGPYPLVDGVRECTRFICSGAEDCEPGKDLGPDRYALIP